jgi:hypothetical protein
VSVLPGHQCPDEGDTYGFNSWSWRRKESGEEAIRYRSAWRVKRAHRDGEIGPEPALEVELENIAWSRIYFVGDEFEGVLFVVRCLGSNLECDGRDLSSEKDGKKGELERLHVE